MEALILAAGPGKRFKDLSKYIPKPLLPVANKPIIERLLRILESVGVKEVTVVVGHLGHKIIRKINSLKDLNLRIKYVKAKNYLKGPISSFLSAIDEIIGKNFILAPADCLLNQNIMKKIIEGLEDKTTLTVHPYIGKGTKVYVGSNNEVNGVNMPIKNWEKITTSIGIMYITSDFLEYVKKAAKRGSTRIIDAINIAIRKGFKIKALCVKEKWFDIDNIQALLEANNYYLEKLTYVNKELDIPDVKIHPPVLLENDIKIGKNCEIGPYVSVGRKAEIGEKCKLQNMIIVEDSKIPPRKRFSKGIFYKNTFLVNREDKYAKNKGQTNI